MKVIFTLIGVGIVVLWLWGGGLTELCKEGGKNVESIESLFTGLAFLGMMIAIYFQKEELKLQRQELSETREELRRSAEANEEAAKLAKENIDAQKIMSYELNHSIRSQIESERIHGIINLIYKKIEYTTSNNSHGARGGELQKESEKINKLLDKLAELSTLPSTPGA